MGTYTTTFSDVDVEATFRRFRSDMLMIADSTKAISRAEVEKYADDAEYFAKRGYLKQIDVTLLSNGVEHRACTYTVNEQTRDFDSSRPGGVLWPRLNNAEVRVIFSRTDKCTDALLQAAQPYLKIPWGQTTTDVSHALLTTTGARNYISNGFELQRKDFGR